MLRDQNLDGATFEERAEIVTKLGIEVYPAEDLKSMRVRCLLDPGIRPDKEQRPATPNDPEGGLEDPDRWLQCSWLIVV